MKNAFLFLAGIFSLVAWAADNEGPAIYSQSYTILFGGSAAGTETVAESIGASGNLLSRSNHDIIVADGREKKRLVFSTEMALSRDTWMPVSYLYKYTSGGDGDSCHVVIKDFEAKRTLNHGGRTSETTASFTQDTVIVDFNVYHQYDYLVRRYDFEKGGTQVFSNFIPVIGNDLTLELTLLGEEKLPLKEGNLSLKKFRVELGSLWSATMTMDGNGRLVRLSVPQQDLEVIRTDLLYLIQN